MKSEVPTPNTCTACPRHLLCANPGLSGQGFGAAEVLVVLSQPTSRDDMAGQLASGTQGTLLASILSDGGFDPARVYVTSAVKCGGKAPTPGEIDACRPWLAEEIAGVRPAAILALGDGALRALTKQAGMQTKRGKSYPLHASLNCGTEEIVWPTYALGNIMASPQVKNVIVADLRRVADRTKPVEEIPWQWWEPGMFIPEGPVGFDIETDYDRKTKTGGDNMIQCAVATGNMAYVAYGVENSHALARTLADRQHVFTLNGWDFDNPKCRALGIAVPHGLDVMGLAYLDDETQPLSLESLAVKYLGVRGWKDLRDAIPGTADFALYNAKDASYTRALASELYRRLAGRRITLATHVMAPARLALDACTSTGMPLNESAIYQAGTDFREKLRVSRDKVVELSGYREFNPSSNREVGRVLNNEVLNNQGITLPVTDGGDYCTSKHVLSSLTSPFVDALLDYRQARKAVSTYVEPYERALVSPTGRVHPHYTIWRTVTNRTSARNPNVQNLPRDLKQFFNAYSVDYGSIEFRIAAWCANETGILNRYAANEEWDAHTFFAALFYDLAEEMVTKPQRQVAKSANFSQLYLGNGATLQAYAGGMGIHLSRHTCDSLHRRWHEVFPAFMDFYRQTLEELLRHGYVETATGYRRHFGDPRLLTGPRRAAALREAVNVKVQTLAAHVALIGLAECHRQGLPVCGFIHDANLFDFKTEQKAIDAAPLIRYCMLVHPINVLRETFGVDLTVPLTVEMTAPNGEKIAA